MVFSFSKENNEVLNLNVDIDYFNKKVYFGDNVTKHPEINFSKLEEAILEALTPKEIDQPEISEEVFERAKKVREDDYSQSFMRLSPGISNS